MILVNTNVISEPMRPAPDPRVIEWLGAQALETLYLNTIIVAELRFGAWSLPRQDHRRPRGASLGGLYPWVDMDTVMPRAEPTPRLTGRTSRLHRTRKMRPALP